MKIHRSHDQARTSRTLLLLFLVAFVWPNCLRHSLETSADSPSTGSAEKPTGTAQADARLSPEAFADPPLQARPGCFWDWLNGSITKDQITRDLEAMKRAGMRGGEIWDVAAYADPDGRVHVGPPFLGPESAQLIAHAIREADRLGLEIGLVASSGWNAGGSWVPPEHAGKGLYHSQTSVAGPRVFHEELPLPELPKLCPRDESGRPVYLSEVAVLAVPYDEKKAIADVSRIVDLTDKVLAEGKLRWDVPAGDWSILRFVCANHGQQLIVPSPNSGGPMIDFFDPASTEFHLRHILTVLLKELGRTSFEGTSFKTIEFDSMELDGFTPWNASMAAEFRRRAGYSAIPFLPLLAGWTLADRGTQELFLYDWRKTVSDRLIESHYVTGRRFLASYGVNLIAESGGPGPPIWDSNPGDGIKALGAVDIPRGEFWIRHRGIFLVKEIASAAHVYGKRLVDAESFTTWRRWVDGPLNHKDIADRALGEGLNNFSLHTFASSPPEAGLPGWVYHAGTDINPAVPWWPMASGLMDYLARCSYMLRQGWFVADVCYYYGDQAPNFFPSLCNVPEKPRLEGLDPRNDFDVCSSEVILRRMRVDKGRIVLPDAMSYAALVLPEQDHIPVEVLEKVRALLADGATVIGRQRPTRAPGLEDNERKSQDVKRLADEIWGRGELPDEPAAEAVSIRPVGRGRLVLAADRSRALREIGVDPDFEVSSRPDGDLGPLDFIHRKTRDDEFYFVRNATREPQALTCLFRVAAEANGLVPEFWWPDSGRRSACGEWRTVANSRTELPLELGPLGSVFVVFRKAGASDRPRLDPLARDTFRAAEDPTPLLLDGPWEVEFPEGWGAPRATSFSKLRSWTESDDEGIRFFSGIATYRKTFELPEELIQKDRLFLELGGLAEIAEVTLNGQQLGLVWLPPFRIEISGAVRPGRNQVEIRVANLWANRLNADSLRPESDRFTRSNIDRIQTDPTSDSSYGRVPRGKTRPVYDKIPPLMRSGLFGPVRVIMPAGASRASSAADGPTLLGNRFLTFATVVRVRQIEVARDLAEGPDESGVHTPAEARLFRETIARAWPGARITWAFSWLALNDPRPDYRALRDLVVSYHARYGDEITFIPGGFFANMYNTREQVNRDLHDGLRLVSNMVGGGYRPRCVIAGFLASNNLRHLAEVENIHVCQGNIWSQHAIDNGDGDGSVSYPYYPSTEHFLKPAQGREDLIDCVNLDGWTFDFLTARRAGQTGGFRSRTGVGPIETLLAHGTEKGLPEMLATTAAHFDDGFRLNGFAWVTNIWELVLVEGRRIYGYQGRNGLDGLERWLSEIRRRWPEAKAITHGEFGLLWRGQFKDNAGLDYRFDQRGSGFPGSEPDKRIRWFMNKDFRLALLGDADKESSEKVIDFTRYDLTAKEPSDPKPGEHIRNWSLMNRLNQKGLRPVDRPLPLSQLTAEERAIILRRIPELGRGAVK